MAIPRAESFGIRRLDFRLDFKGAKDDDKSFAERDDVLKWRVNIVLLKHGRNAELVRRTVNEAMRVADEGCLRISTANR